jgi:hypothetical protein
MRDHQHTGIPEPVFEHLQRLLAGGRVAHGGDLVHQIPVEMDPIESLKASRAFMPDE